MARIAELVATLEKVPASAKKSKQTVLGDWKMKFAADHAAVDPFTAGAAKGPFAVLEDVYCRMLSGDKFQFTEVVRKIGPFGNVAQSLHGRYSQSKGGDALSLKLQYMIDERGRGVSSPREVPARMEWGLTYCSPELLILRRAADAQSYVIFEKLGKGALQKELDDFSVGAEVVLGVQ